MTFINILIVAIWKSRHAFRAYGWGNMPLQAVKRTQFSNSTFWRHTHFGDTLVVQNSSPTRLSLVGDEFWTTRVRIPVSKMFRWRTYNSHGAQNGGISNFCLKITKSSPKRKRKAIERKCIYIRIQYVLCGLSNCNINFRKSFLGREMPLSTTVHLLVLLCIRPPHITLPTEAGSRALVSH